MYVLFVQRVIKKHKPKPAAHNRSMEIENSKLSHAHHVLLYHILIIIYSSGSHQCITLWFNNETMIFVYVHFIIIHTHTVLHSGWRVHMYVCVWHLPIYRYLCTTVLLVTWPSLLRLHTTTTTWLLILFQTRLFSLAPTPCQIFWPVVKIFDHLDHSSFRPSTWFYEVRLQTEEL